MEQLSPLVGLEHDSADLRRAVVDWLGEPAGVVEITCSDDPAVTEIRSGGATWLPVVNPGSRYEIGSVALMERCLTHPIDEAAARTVLVRVLGHAVTPSANGAASCAALADLLEGRDGPRTRELDDTFRSAGLDRVHLLKNEKLVDASARPLLAAIVGARLQARRVALDLVDHEADVPTRYAVLHGISLCRGQLCTELFGGLYSIDADAARYVGLSDDPAMYSLLEEDGRLRLEDDGCRTVRDVEDHRESMRKILAATPWPDPRDDERLRQFVDLIERDEMADALFTRTKLRVVLRIVSTIVPLHAARYLFAEGLVELRHVDVLGNRQVTAAQVEAARQILLSAEVQLEQVPDERVRPLLEGLLTER